MAEEIVQEEWRVCPGFPDYSVSNLGRIRRDNNGARGKAVAGRILKPCPNPYGYLTVSLCLGSTVRTKPIHRLVALAFLGAPPVDRLHVNHIDGCKTNNGITNLEFCSPKENQQHASRLGLMQKGNRHYKRRHPEKAIRGEQHGMAKLTDEKVREIRRRAEQGEGPTSIGRSLNVSKSTIIRAVSRRNWKHVA